MKAICSLLLFMVATFTSVLYAQNNVFPSAGRAGIGTTLPNFSLQISEDQEAAALQLSSKTSGHRDDDGLYLGFLDWGALLCEDQLDISAYSLNFQTLSTAGKFSPQGQTHMTIRENGRIGFGTTSPTEDFHANLNARFNKRMGIGGAISPNAQVHVTVTGTDIGSMYSNTNNSLRVLPRLGVSGYSHLSQADDFGIFFSDGQAGSGRNRFSGFVLAPVADSKSGLRMDGDGNVSIGIDDSQGYKLAVNGHAIATEMVVKLHYNWPDYVFEYDYDLMPLSELRDYIRQHKHLPGIPSEAEVSEEGIAVGEMHAQLLKKIEELTLYVLELKAENEAIRAQLAD